MKTWKFQIWHYVMYVMIIFLWCEVIGDFIVHITVFHSHALLDKIFTGMVTVIPSHLSEQDGKYCHVNWHTLCFYKVEYFNNYLRDPRRPQLPEHPSSKPSTSSQPVPPREPYIPPTSFHGPLPPPPPVSYRHAPYGGRASICTVYSFSAFSSVYMSFISTMQKSLTCRMLHCQN